MWMDDGGFMPLPAEGRRSRSQVLAIINEAAVNFGGAGFVWTEVFASFG